MRIFQTFVLPDNLVAKYKLSFAAANFSRNLLSGSGFDKCYSLLPVNVKGELPAISEDGYEVVYSKWRSRCGLLAKLAIFKEQIYIFRHVHTDDSIWLYNLNIINALLFVLLKLFKPSVKLNVIILDFTPANSWKEQNYWYLKLLNKADGTICLAYSDLFKCANTAVLAGVVPISSGQEPLITTPNKKFLLSGVLREEIAQTTMVLEAFSKLPDCELHITGKTDNETLVKGYAERFENIIWHGMVSYEEYLKLLHRCTFVLSTRDPGAAENMCNFPSKIVESLLHNRIVVSTIQYKQLDGINYFNVPSENESFINCINNISSLNNNSLCEYANQGNVVAKMFGTKVWNDAMTIIENAQ